MRSPALDRTDFDGAYVHNDEMMAGALQAMQEAGLDPGKYWLGSCNGKEKAWDWVKKGMTTMDANETPTLEADVAHQQIKAYFEGKPFKKAIFNPIVPFTKTDINTDKLIPYDHDAYMKKRDAGAFVYDMNDPSFRANPAY